MPQSNTKMKNLPSAERPYERFLAYGPQALSDAELLAIILKSGTKGMSSLDLARKLLSGGQGNLLNLYDYSMESLCSFPGMGQVKAIQLKALLELSQRLAQTQRGFHITLKDPASIADYYMESMRHLKKEILVCAFFDAKCKWIGDQTISQGSCDFAFVSPKDIFRAALEKNATMLVLLHNHPSGDPYPSQDDCRVTERIREGAELLGLRLADHIIIGDNRYYSFLEQDR